MPTPTSSIISSIDRSVDLTPRPPVWLRALVGAALAIPVAFGLIMGMGVKPTEPMVSRDGQVTLQDDWNNSFASKPSTPSQVPPATPVTPIKPVPPSTPEVTGGPTPPETGAPLATVTEIDNIFGQPDPSGSEGSDPGTAPSTASSTNKLSGGGLVGLDIPGVPSSPGPSVDVPGPSVDLPDPGPITPTTDVPSPTVDVPSPTVDVPSPTVDVPSPTVDVPSPTVDVPSPTVDVPSPTVDVPAPPTSTKNLYEQMLETKALVSKELDERYPMYKADANVTLNLITGQSATGKIIFLQTDFLALDARGDRRKIEFRTLHPSSRIRCDRDFRDQQIDKETEKRMLEAFE